jgi:hypothetical protein
MERAGGLMITLVKAGQILLAYRILGQICLGSEEMSSSPKILLPENSCGSDGKARESVVV